MKLAWFALILLQLSAALPAFAQKLMLAHVAVNPSQGMLHLAKDSGILAKYGLSADVLLIPGTPRTIQALIAGDLDYVAAGAPASLRARAQGADVTILSTLANSSAQRVFVRPDSKLGSFMDLKGKIVGVTQYGSGGDTFLRGALRKHGIKESEVTILQMGGTPGVAQGLESGRIEVGVLGDSGLLLVFRGRAKPLKGASAREMGFRGVDAPLTTTDRKIKADRGAVIRFMQAYLETVHFFLNQKAGNGAPPGQIYARRERGAYFAVVRRSARDYQAGALSRRRGAAHGIGNDEYTGRDKFRRATSITASSTRSKRAGLSTNCTNNKRRKESWQRSGISRSKWKTRKRPRSFTRKPSA
jgi:ABC-type nitrate/sulfonate/bicarbonate transport system substrate-binding protein